MVVRMRRNRSETAMRRSHHAITGVRLARCECGALHQSHKACPTCGKYNGRVVIDVVAREKREQRRTKRRQMELRASGQESPNTSDKETTQT